MCKYAVIGFGCAGYHAAKALRERAPDSRIDVYSDTGEAPANPMLTTYYVAGKIGREAQFPLGAREDIVRALGLRLFIHTPVKRVWARDCGVELEDGRREVYDAIVLATGSQALVPPIPGRPEQDVFVMRTPADADRLLARIGQGVSSALVIGASWVGVKVAEALYAHSVPTVIADMAPRIFPTAVLPGPAEIIRARLDKLGVGLKLGCGIQAMRREADGIVSVFQDGSEFKSEIVALCLGVRPAVGCLDKDEVAIGRGIRVNRRMETSAPRIYAAGDCCEAQEVATGQVMPVSLWANAVLQGRIAGCNAAGGREEYQGNFIHNVTHFLGMDFIGLGDNRAQGEALAYVSPEGWRLDMVCREGRPVCVNLLDNHGLSGPLKALLLKQLSGPPGRLGTEAAATLSAAGLPEHIIEILEGGDYGNA